MHTDLVRLGREPCQIQPLRAILAHGILPIESGDKSPARIANHRNAQLAHAIDHVAPEALFVRERMRRLVNAAVNRATEMFDERAVHPWVDPADRVSLVQNHFCNFHEL